MANSVLAVITPARTRDLTTLATVKDEFGIKDTKSDVRLRRWIRDASGAIETYTRRIWATETVVETFYHRHGSAGSYRLWTYPTRHGISLGALPHSLCLARYPVSGVASITEDDTALVTTDYRLDGTQGILYRLSADGSPVEWFGSETIVTYTAGYDLLDGLPPEVEQACLTLLKHRWSSRDRDPLLRQINVPGVQEETYWVGGIGDNGAMPPEVAGLLAQHIDMRS
jgi:hypothetical protein